MADRRKIRSIIHRSARKAAAVRTGLGLITFVQTTAYAAQHAILTAIHAELILAVGREHGITADESAVVESAFRPEVTTPVSPLGGVLGRALETFAETEAIGWAAHRYFEEHRAAA